MRRTRRKMRNGIRLKSQPMLSEFFSFKDIIRIPELMLSDKELKGERPQSCNKTAPGRNSPPDPCIGMKIVRVRPRERTKGTENNRQMRRTRHGVPRRGRRSEESRRTVRGRARGRRER